MNRYRSKLDRDCRNEKQRFSIRKLTIGAASVLIGTAFYLNTGTTPVKAAKNNINDPATTEVVKKQNSSTSNQNNSSNQESSNNKEDSSQSTKQAVTRKTALASNNSSKISIKQADHQQNKEISSQIDNENSVDKNNGQKEQTVSKNSSLKSQNSNVLQKQSLSIPSSQQNSQDNNKKSVVPSAEEQKKLALLYGSEKTKEQIPTFSGTVYFSPKKEYKSNGTQPDTQYINYRISTYGNSTIKNPQYLLMLPAGFDAGTLNWSNPSLLKNCQDLGHVGPNGEQTYLITTSSSPAWTGLWVNTYMKPNKQYGGEYTYSDRSPVPLISALSNSAKEGADAASGGGEVTLKLTNGQTYDVVRSIYTINEKQWYKNGSTVSYSVMPGDKPLANSNYSIQDTKVFSKNGDKTHSGYEELDTTIQINNGQNIKAGDYIDFRLGIPLADGTTLAYDINLNANIPLIDKHSNINYGEIYRMDNYYRLVFNGNVQRYISAHSSLKIPIQLRWNSGTAYASVKPEKTNGDYGKTYVYQYTDNPNLNQTVFAYHPTDDVNIGGQLSNSGLTVTGKYIARGKVFEANEYNVTQTIYSTNRTWDNQNNVSINTGWYNNIAVKIATNHAKKGKNASNNFSVTVSVGKNSLLNYTWASDADLENQIKNIIATYIQHTLSKPTEKDNNIYTQDTSTDTKKFPSTNITVTHTENNSDPTHLCRTYHIKISNPDIQLRGAFTPLSIWAPGFTMPTDIRSYNDDLNHALINGNFGQSEYKTESAITSNESLKKVLEDTPISLSTIKNDTTEKDVLENSGLSWLAGIGYSQAPLGNTNGAQPSAYITATLIFKDDSKGINQATVVGPSDGLKDQDRDGKTISFSNANKVMQDLIEQGYTLDKVVSVLNGKSTNLTSSSSDPNKIESYNFGKFGDLSKNPIDFIVYVKKVSNNQKAEVHFVDDDAKDVEIHKTIDSTGKANTDINFNDINEIVVDLKKKHYQLVRTYDDTNKKQLAGDDTTDWTKGIFGTFDNNDLIDQKFTIHFKHQHSDLVKSKATVNETINYIYGDGPHKNEIAHDPDSAKLTFIATGYHDDVTDKDIYRNWTPTKSSFDAITLPKITNYYVSSATQDDTAKTDELSDDKKSVKAINNITSSSKNVVITVIYMPIEKASYNIHYIDVTNSNKTNNYQPTDGNEIAGHEITGISGAIGTHSNVTKKLWQANGDNGYIAAGYVLAEPAPTDLGKAIFERGMHDQYVYLKKAKKPSTVTGKAYVVYYDNDEKSFINKDGSYQQPKNWSKLLEDCDDQSKDNNSTISVSDSHLKDLEDKNYVFAGISAEQLLTDLKDIKPDTSNVNKSAKLSNLGTFDSDKNTDQYFVVHLTHKTQQVKQQTVTVTRTITYVYDDSHNTKVNDTSISTNPVTQTITFTGTGTLDLVTNKYIHTDKNNHKYEDKNLEWTSDHNDTLAGITSPTTLSDGSILETASSKTDNESDNDNLDDKYNVKERKNLARPENNETIQVTIYYKKPAKPIQQNKGTVTVYYIDTGVNPDLTKKQLSPTNYTKEVDHKETNSLAIGNLYTLTPYDYSANGYELATPTLPTGTTSGSISKKGNTDIYVYLKHKTSAIKNPQTRDVTEVIKYVDEHNNPVHSNYGPVKITFTRDGYYDEVAKKDVYSNTWASKSSQFDSVTIPNVSGYHVVSATLNDAAKTNELSNDKNSVNAIINLTHDSENIVITVIFAKNSSKPGTGNHNKPPKGGSSQTQPSSKPDKPDKPSHNPGNQPPKGSNSSKPSKPGQPNKPIKPEKPNQSGKNNKPSKNNPQSTLKPNSGKTKPNNPNKPTSPKNKPTKPNKTNNHKKLTKPVKPAKTAKHRKPRKSGKSNSHSVKPNPGTFSKSKHNPGYSYNNSPHGEHGRWQQHRKLNNFRSNAQPHSEHNNFTENYRPQRTVSNNRPQGESNPESIQNGMAPIKSTTYSAPFTSKNSRISLSSKINTQGNLPVTGEKQNRLVQLGIIALAATLGLTIFGIINRKKKRN